MFAKVLVANRGEIACRVIRTLRRMGIGSVAVFTDADAGSMHVGMADEAVGIGDGPATTSYLDGARLIDVAVTAGADAVHPGYGFLSENAAFAEGCTAAGITWVGPSPDHLRRFGDKHEARELARQCNVPLLAGSGLLAAAPEALAAAERIGYPVMVKATSGGGGIGMQRCDRPEELEAAFDTVTRLAALHFAGGGVFVERFVTRARHIEVQIFGAAGEVVALGDRDCSAQRRNQKVLEECPAPGLMPDLREQLWSSAVRLGREVGYRSAGTVEFVVDADRGDASFLEVNTRLQVEHGVTELVWGIDLVEWMLLEACGELNDLGARAAAARPHGAAIEARLYAEDPNHGNRPSTGIVSSAVFPEGIRVDTWIEPGTEVTPYYDPLLAKVVVHAADREAAVNEIDKTLRRTHIEGVLTNVDFLASAVADARFVAGGYTTRFLEGVRHGAATVEVIAPGMQTTVQDHPGRLGYWAVGVPPSGPMDDLAFRLGNRLLGNDASAAGLEISFAGPTIRFETAALIALTGAPMDADVDGVALPWWTVVEVEPGSTLRVGTPTAGGCRAYLLVRGGIDVPAYLGSRATFLLGGFGGQNGRALATGDVLRVGGAPVIDEAPIGSTVPADLIPAYGRAWDLTVTDGPHGAPDFFTDAGMEALFDVDWEVHHHSDRTGIRLVGPAPQWARPDGGEAGLHPSNIHDNAYAIGTVDFTGDMPVILGPDGPSLGGFVCPVTVVTAERWKIGQLAPGDRVRLRRVDNAVRPSDPVLRQRAAGPDRPTVTYRRAGDSYLLVEYGPNVLDLELRFRVGALMEAVTRGQAPGVEEMTPGIRSLQIRFDPSVVTLDALVEGLEEVENHLPDTRTLVVPSRIVHLPLSWDDPATRLAIERYMQVVRDDAPWCPWNIEFIRRINGLDSVDDVRRIVFDASYLVLGLGDVYLGAPVATPLDPRHRLVTTKYNPARTWTPENAVGIGGAYLCVYGMEGPGGYQFVGRTIQVWNRHRETADYHGSTRWLLRFFDQLRFYPVSAEELLVLRREAAAGRGKVEITETTLSLAEHQRFLSEEADSIAAFKMRQQSAFDAERVRWDASGEFDRAAAGAADSSPVAVDEAVPDGAHAVTTPVNGMVARVASIGDEVSAGDTVVVVEAMKTETSVVTSASGTVTEVRCAVGQMVAPGAPLVVVVPA